MHVRRELTAALSALNQNIGRLIMLVAMYSLTNFINNVFDPKKDFPAVPPAGSI